MKAMVANNVMEGQSGSWVQLNVQRLGWISRISINFLAEID